VIAPKYTTTHTGMSQSLKRLELQAGRNHKNVVIRCPSTKGKHATYDYFYRTSATAESDDLQIGATWVPTLRLATKENKRTYNKIGKADWTPVGGVYCVTLVSPVENELIGHAPFENLGKWPSPAKQPTPAPEAARYTPPVANGRGVAASGSADTPVSSRFVRNAGPNVMARLTGASNSPPLSQNPNFINSQGGTTRVGFIDVVPMTEDQVVLHEVFGPSPTTADPPISHEETLTPARPPSTVCPTINIIPPTQALTTAGSSHEEIPTIVVVPATQDLTTAGPSHEDPACPSPSLEVRKTPSPTRPNTLPLIIAHETPVPEPVPESVTGSDDGETSGCQNLEHLLEAIEEDAAPFFSWVSLIPPTDPPVTALLEPQSIKVGKLLAEVSNIQAAKLRHVNEIADGRPPVIPLARAFQCPSMGRVATEDLVNAWNQAMLKCAQEMSLALVHAEERVEKELRAQLQSEIFGWNFTQDESLSVKMIRDARIRKQHPYKPNTDPLVFFELDGTGDKRKIIPHESAIRANTSGHKIPGKAKEAKATEAEVTGAKATNAKKKPEVPVPRTPKNPPKKSAKKGPSKGKEVAPTLPSAGSGQRGQRSRTKKKGEARPNPGPTVRRGSVSFITEVPAKAPQPTPSTVVTEVVPNVAPQVAPAATVAQPAQNRTPAVVTTGAPTGGTQVTPAVTVAPKPAPKPGKGSDPNRRKAPAPRKNGNTNQRGGSGRISENRPRQEATAPSKNYQRSWTGQQSQNERQQYPNSGSYNSSWRSAPNPPPLRNRLSSPPPRPPPWALPEWSTGYQHHRVDEEEGRWRPLRYVERDGPDQNRSGWMNPFRK
jgi:hypothetical protein